MKTLFCTLVHLGMCVFTLPAQLVSISAIGINRGIYFSSEEFVRNQPTESPQDCSKSECFTLWDNFGMPTLKVKTSIKTFIYPAGTVFGFVDCYGRIFRYFNEHYYQVIELGHINLYARTQKSMNTGFLSPETEYFFSVSTDSEIFPLERQYFLDAYAHQPDFASHVDDYFYPNVSLKQFNTKTGTYEISKVYSDMIGAITAR